VLRRGLRRTRVCVCVRVAPGVRLRGARACGRACTRAASRVSLCHASVTTSMRTSCSDTALSGGHTTPSSSVRVRNGGRCAAGSPSPRPRTRPRTRTRTSPTRLAPPPPRACCSLLAALVQHCSACLLPPQRHSQTTHVHARHARTSPQHRPHHHHHQWCHHTMIARTVTCRLPVSNHV
jgi:hypothetical protein